MLQGLIKKLFFNNSMSNGKSLEYNVVNNIAWKLRTQVHTVKTRLEQFKRKMNIIVQEMKIS